MQIAVHVLAYDVSAFINAMLRNVAPHVDKIYLAYPPRPFDYIQSSRDTRVNPTKLENIDLSEFKNKVEIIKGDWAKEEDSRNACFERAKAEGFDWLIIQDADEFCTEDSWRQLRRALESDSKCELFKTTWLNFWKSSDFIIVDRYGSIKDHNAGFAIRCKPDLRFTNRRGSNAQEIRLLDCPCYHYGFVKTDQEMYEKVTQWSHAHEFNGPQWYEIKWLNWNYDTVNLSPLYTSWKRAIRFPLHQPDFAAEFAYPVSPEKKLSLKDTLRGTVYDLHFGAVHGLRRIKSLVRG